MTVLLLQVNIAWANSVLAEEGAVTPLRNVTDVIQPDVLATLIDILWPAAKVKQKLKVRYIVM